jgi:hypothetical protein
MDEVGIAVEVGEQSCQLSAKTLAISSWHLAGHFFESSRITLNSFPIAFRPGPLAFTES